MYIFLITIFILAIVCVYTSGGKLYRVCILNKKYLMNLDSIFFKVLLVCLFLFWTLKSSTVGFDTNTYRYMYGIASNYVGIGMFRYWTNQPLYYLIFSLLEWTGMSFRSAQVVFYVFACSALSFFINKYSQNKVLSLFFFVMCGSMAMYSSALRQMLAITFGIFATHFSLKKNFGKTVFCIVAAILLHKSACVLLILLLLYFFVPSKKQLVLYTPCIWMVALLLPSGIIRWAASMFVYEVYSQHIGESSNILLIAMYFCMGLFVWYIMNTTEWNSCELRFFTSLFVVSIAIILFSSKFFLITRVQYYFQVVQYVVFAEATRRLNNRKSLLLFVFVILLFTVFFLFSLNADVLSMTPYQFFWNAGEEWK